MSAAPSLWMRATGDIPYTTLPDLMQACAERLQAGAHLLTLFGRTDAEPSAAALPVCVTAVLQDRDGLCVLRARAARGEHYPALTTRFALAHVFERELWEQTGLVPEGHPWLKPVRFEGDLQGHLADYPFFKVRGAEVHEVGVGPIHASVIEPGHFRFMCLGERVHHLEIQLGYQHRAVERLLLRRQPLALTSAIESVVGDSAIAYAWTYCAAVEALAGRAAAPPTELVRAVALELERIAMHLAGLTGLATDIAFLQGGATYGRLRTAIINASMRICGNRFGRGWLHPGGVRFGLDIRQRADLGATLEAFAQDFNQVNQLMRSAITVRARFQSVGTVSNTDASAVGLVGLAARASGVALDTRTSLPGTLYSDFPVELVTETGGDCWARLTLRMKEIDASLAWLRTVLSAPGLALDSPAALPLVALQKNTLCVSLREGFRGEVVQVLETDGAGALAHYKLQDPSLRNWFGLALSLRNNDISDFPLCNKSFDLSYCGNDL